MDKEEKEINTLIDKAKYYNDKYQKTMQELNKLYLKSCEDTYQKIVQYYNDNDGELPDLDELNEIKL